MQCTIINAYCASSNFFITNSSCTSLRYLTLAYLLHFKHVLICSFISLPIFGNSLNWHVTLDKNKKIQQMLDVKQTAYSMPKRSMITATQPHCLRGQTNVEQGRAPNTCRLINMRFLCPPLYMQYMHLTPTYNFQYRSEYFLFIFNFYYFFK